MRAIIRLSQLASLVVTGLLITGCASTTVSITPASQAPVCASESNALILWAPMWRKDQKDATERELAAAAGINAFFAKSGCFAKYEIRRIPDTEATTISQHISSTTASTNQTLVIGVRELGPTVKLLSSVALLEGGTEVVLQIAVHPGPFDKPSREYSVHWQHAGPGTIKGIASLPADMQAALTAGLQARAVK